MLDLARSAKPQDFSRVSFEDAAAIRRDIAQAVPAYAEIEKLSRQGDQFQWGGPHLCANRSFPIELGTGLAYAAVYRWTLQGGLSPAFELTAAALHALYLVEVMLLSLMIVATFIDLDEQTIPDAITVYGTLAALMIAAALPQSRLPILQGGWPAGVREPGVLQIASPNDWPAELNTGQGLLYGLLCYIGWCYADHALGVHAAGRLG